MHTNLEYFCFSIQYGYKRWDFFYLLEIFKQIGWKGYCAVVHNCHGKRNNPAANEQDSRQKKKPYDKKEKTHAKRKNLATKE